MGHLQFIQSFETSIETGNLQSYVEQSIKQDKAGFDSQLDIEKCCSLKI